MSKVKYPIFKCMHRGEKGFTLIELLVVIAILGVIAAVVALNVGNFFGAGVVQSANTELHQVQTAIIAAMAECESGTLNMTGATWWAGAPGVITADCTPSVTDANDAAFYVYGPLRAAYQIDTNGTILDGSLTDQGAAVIGDPWVGIQWNDDNDNWEAVP